MQSLKEAHKNLEMTPKSKLAVIKKPGVTFHPPDNYREQIATSIQLTINTYFEVLHFLILLHTGSQCQST